MRAAPHAGKQFTCKRNMRSSTVLRTTNLTARIGLCCPRRCARSICETPHDNESILSGEKKGEVPGRGLLLGIQRRGSTTGP